MIRIKKGFTLLEVMIVIAIITILAGITIYSLSGWRNRRTLDGAAAEVVTALAQARQKTLSGVGDGQWGLQLQFDHFVIFKGDSYNPSDANNQVTNLDNLLTISATTLNGGGSDVIFSRLTGKTNNWGEVVVSLKSDPGQSRQVRIKSTGLAEIE